MVQMASVNTQQIAPGTRLEIRDEEWLVRTIDRTSNGGIVYGVVGLSPFVEGKEARFIREIEESMGKVTVVDPRKTEALPDQSPYYRETRLMLESHLRATTPESGAIHIGHRGAMDVLNYQLEPATLALAQPRQRILIADTVGLGKTIECGILLAELIKRGRGRRILVVTVQSMLTQFQKELWSRFALPLTRLDSAGLQRVRRKIPTNHNPFHYFDKSIISIDTLKQDGEYRTHLERAWWDIIVIDEAHNVAERGTSRASNSLRSRAARLLAARSDSLILLSATPHDGKRGSFASLMYMLNPTAIKDPKNYGPEDIDGLFIRRFKKDVKDQIAGNFPERSVHTPRTPASPAEETAFEHLASLQFVSMDRTSGKGGNSGGNSGGGKILFRTLLEKALFSSPAACASTIRERIKRLAKRDTNTDEAQKDITELEGFLQTVEVITPEHFAKFELLVTLLQKKGADAIGWNPRNADDRLVIFTERIDTLKFLETELAARLKLKPKQVATLYGSMGDLDQQGMVEAFGAADSPIRLLICSDIASEGINLHHQSHRMIHFDIPWSLLTFQQRNGRIDRYGQTREPEIYYLLTDSKHDKIRGDQRILELLIEKDAEVQANIGDPSEFTGLHSAEEEEAAVAQAMQSDSEDRAKALEQQYTDQSAKDAWFDNLIAGLSPVDAFTSPEPESPDPKRPSRTATLPSLYQNDWQWAREGFQTLCSRDVPLDITEDKAAQQLAISVPKDLRRRFQKYPPQLLADPNGLIVLSADRAAVNRDIIACRAEQGRWPRLQLLWEQHPAIRWMQDKLLGKFGRNTASCVHLRHLDPGEHIVLGTGIIPNRRGQPVVQRWHGIQFINGKLNAVLSLDETLARIRLEEDHPNPQPEVDTTAIQALFPAAVDALTAELSQARDAFNKRTEPELQSQLDKLKAFRDARTNSIDSKLTDPKQSTNRERIQAEQRQVDRLYEDYKAWITDTMKTEDAPSIRLFAVFWKGEG